MKSPIPIRVLIVEDSEDDTRLIVREMERGHYEPEFEQVDNAEAMSSALRREKWDIVLSDYSMPNFSGPEALILLQQSGLDIPFILISGKIGEEEAVAVIKDGAGDFISKDRLQRLPVAVERELREMEVRRQRQQMQDALKESEEKYRNLVERANDGICIIQDGLVRYANPRLAEMWGGTVKELTNTPFVNHIHPDELPKVVDRYNRRMAGEQLPTVYETVLKRKDSSKLYTELNIGVINYLGKPAELVIIRDVTERKQTEEALLTSEENFHRSMEDSPLGIRIANEENELLYANKAVMYTWGYNSLEEMKAVPLSKRFTPESYANLLERVAQRRRGEPIPSSYENNIVRKDGEVRHLKIWVKEVIWNGQMRQLRLSEDITEQKLAEDKVISLSRFPSENPNPVLRIMQDGLVVYANQASTPLLYHWHTKVGEYVNEKVHQQLKQTILENRVQEIEVDLPDESFSCTLTPIQNNGYVNIYARDITKRKQVEKSLQETVQDLQIAQHLTKIGNWKLVIATNQVTWSEELCHINGWDVNLPVPPFAEMDRFYTPESWGRLTKQVTKALNTGESYVLELTQIRTDGTEINTFCRGEADYDASGKVVGLHGTVQDITERKQTEEKIRESEERYRTLFESANEGIIITDSETKKNIYANPAICAMLGYSREELTRMTVMDVHPQDSLEYALAEFDAITKGKKNYTTLPCVKKDGSIIIADISATNTIIDKRDCNIGFFTDITEHKRAEDKLLEERGFTDSVIRSLPGLFYCFDSAGVLLRWNDNLEKTFGYSPKELSEMNAIGFFAQEDKKAVAEAIQDVFVKGVSSVEGRMVTKNGDVIPHFLTGARTQIGGKPYLVGVGSDITERKQAEEEIRKFKIISDIAAYGLTMLDKEQRITYTNRTCARLHGYEPEELIGQHCTIFVPADQIEAVNRIFEKSEQTGSFANEEMLHRRKDGTVFPALMTGVTVKDDKGKPLYTSVIFIDITERKKMQEQLIAQDRLASIGQLVSGVAHEINNPLTGIVGFSELLLQRNDLPDEAKAELKVVYDEAMRTTLIVKNLLGFSRKQAEGKTSVGINEQIKRVLALRNHEQKVNNINVDARLASDLPQVMGNTSQLQQVFFNIVINAEFFMLKEHNKGNLTITTESMGDFVRCSFADDGPGISEEHVRNLFTPFFTTKEVGKGTGLGLSICHGIVTEHGGRIYAESELGKGATFIVELPIAN